MRRYPSVAGLFYDSDPDSLIETIKWAFQHEHGPGKLPKIANEKLTKNVGLITPHAGYIYSGPIAAWGYFEVSKYGKPDTIVIIGPNHTGVGESVGVWPNGCWETPLGELQIDDEMVEMMIEFGDGIIKEDIRSHENEHSIEVQLPFLQFLYGSDFKLVPITMMDQRLKIAEFLSNVMKRIKENVNKRILFIASSDFNHYESHDETMRKDEILIRKIVEKDILGMYESIRENYITICGYGPVATLLMLDIGTPKLLKHATSGDMSGDYSRVVGYASFVIN